MVHGCHPQFGASQGWSTSNSGVIRKAPYTFIRTMGGGSHSPRRTLSRGK